MMQGIVEGHATQVQRIRNARAQRRFRLTAFFTLPKVLGAGIVMIVQCPGCASRYRVNDANIPPSGGKIRCPSCEHAFVVFPESAGPAGHSDDAEKTRVGAQPGLHDLFARAQNPNTAPQAGRAPSADEDDSARTEVMSGDSLPSFHEMFGGAKPGQTPAIPEEHTVEMANPLDMVGDLFKGGLSLPELHDDINTAEISSDAVRRSIESVKQQRAGQGGVATAARPAGPPPRPAGPPPRPSIPTTGTAPASVHSTIPPSATQPVSDYDSDPKTEAMPPLSFGEEPVASAAPTADPNHVGPWKLRTNFGLTYEFPDTRGLRSWLSNRDELDGYTLSADGENFFDLDAFPQLRAAPAVARHSASMDAVARVSGGFAAVPRTGDSFDAPQPAAAFDPAMPQTPASSPLLNSSPLMTGTGMRDAMPERPPLPEPVAAPPGPRIDAEAYRPPSREAQWNKVLWGLFLILLPIAVAVVAQAFGLYDVKSAIFGAEPEPEYVARPPIRRAVDDTPPEPVRSESDEAERRARQAAQVDRIVADARLDFESNRLPIVIEKLTTARMLDPERIEIYEMLAESFEKLGRSDEATEARDTIVRIRETGSSVAGPRNMPDEG